MNGKPTDPNDAQVNTTRGPNANSGFDKNNDLSIVRPSVGVDPAVGPKDPTHEQASTAPHPGQSCDACDPSDRSGPPREGGGTTGAGNLSPGGANRTGGATSGVDPSQRPPRHGSEPTPDP